MLRISIAQNPYEIYRSGSFTTAPKTRRVLWHKQTTVKTRATALQESFYPTTDVLYSAVVQRMAVLLGICDRASIIAYLGRPQYETKVEMDQTVTYKQSGVQVPKRHKFYRKLQGRKGYIETFGLGYCYVVNGEWLVHWNHTEQTTLSPLLNDESCRQSIVDFSLSRMAAKKPTAANVVGDHQHNNVETTERREEYSLCERNSESESNQKRVATEA